MNHTFTILLLTFISLIVSAQEDPVTELNELLENQKYDEIIEVHSSKAKDYSARAIYYIGLAYYVKSDNDNCIKYMDMSLEKDPENSDAYFTKGMTYNYMSQFENSIGAFQKAIELDSANGILYSGLGDAFYNLNRLERALQAYQKAAEQENVPHEALLMIPHIYHSMNKKDEALEAYYEVREKISKENDSYKDLLYNIGILELLKDHYEEAEAAFAELVAIAPHDYHSYSELIQIHYARREYKKAEPLKQKLYDAYEKGLLKEHMKEMFCFDQFRWKDKLIQAFEMFEEPEGELYYKHLFYIVNENDEVEYRIQTENSVISLESGGPKYILGMNKNNAHYTFNVGLNEDFKYDDLKGIVIEILEGKLTPGASSRIGK